MEADILKLKKQVGEYLLRGVGDKDAMEEISQILKRMDQKDLACWMVDTVLKPNTTAEVLLAEEVVTPIIREKLTGDLMVYMRQGELTWNI